MIVLLAAGLAAPIPKTSHAAEVCAPVLARVVSLQGTVEFRSSETEPWTDAALNDLLCADYWIRVGPSSRAALALPNDSVLRLDQQTTVRLRAQAEETRSLLELLLGTLYLFSHRPRALEIDTPFVNAATEGTEFLVSVGADQTRIIVFEGRILAKNPDGELLLASGEAAVAAAGAAPRAQIVAQPRDAVAWTLYYPPILVALAEREPAARGLPPGLQTAVDRVAANDYPGALRALDTVPDGARDARYYDLSRRRAPERRSRRRRARCDRAGSRARSGSGRGAGAAGDHRARAGPARRSPGGRAPGGRAEPGFGGGAHRAVLCAAGHVPARGGARDPARGGRDRARGRAGLGAPVGDRAVVRRAEARRSRRRTARSRWRRSSAGRRRCWALPTSPASTSARRRRAFERAIALDSADPLPRLGLGLAMIRQSDLEQGRNEIEIAVALDPDNCPAPELSRQGVLRGEARRAGRRTVRDRQAARPAGPHALAL